jgi:hypothetical protein
MADHRCVAIKSGDGQRCSKRGTINGRCGTHNTIVEREGPNHVELDELTYRFKNRMKTLRKENNDEIHALGPQPWLNARPEYTRLLTLHNERERLLNVEAMEERNTIVTRQRADIARTGINPDAVQDARREQQRRERLALVVAQQADWRARMDQRRQDHINERLQHRAVAGQHGAAARIVPPAGGLAGFANDRQNVHTTVAVKQTMNVVKEILKIEVPIEYRWNMRSVSKTMSEIISECELSPASAWQMVSKYCSDETIYDLQPGIYGKVLDCVWQYIKNSSDKDDLKKILKSEMRDNIGMCAQGNLSRLTNILAGYVDAVVVQESMADKLGRMLPPLMEIENIPDRLIAAVRIFVEVELPEDQWGLWGEGLLSDQEDDDYREMFIHDGAIQFVVHR